MNEEPVSNLLLSYIKSRSRVFVYERYRNKSYKNNINWHYISHFEHYADDQIICSICLNEPVLPRMDKCGHIFCLSCLINLSEHEDSNFVLCPVCKNYKINVTESKRVTFATNKSVKPGDNLKFTLLVKGNQSLFPDHFYKLVPPRPNAPFFNEPHSKFANMAIDTDWKVRELIGNDIKTSRQMSSFLVQLNGKEIEHETGQFLYNEMADFALNVALDSLCISPVTEKTPDCFNMTLELKPQLERFTMFHQCVSGRFLMLEPSQSLKLIVKEKKTCLIRGRVLTVRMEKVTPALIDQTKWSHLPLGAMVTIVSIYLRKARGFTVPIKSYADLNLHRRCILSDQEEMEKKRLESEAKRSALAQKGIMFTPMIDDSVSYSVEEPFITRLSDDMIPESFNMCMFGLECVDPDDDYPHAESCPNRNKSSTNEDEWSDAEVEKLAVELDMPRYPSNTTNGPDTTEIPRPSNETTNPEVVDEYTATDSTILSAVLETVSIEPINVVSVQTTNPEVVSESTAPASIECEKNYPPDDINIMKLYIKPDPFLQKYRVEVKKTTQRERKNQIKASKKEKRR